MRLSLFAVLSCLLATTKSQVPETNPLYNWGNHWIFGTNIHLEFKGDSVIQHRISDVNQLEGTSSISDSLGGLDYFHASDVLRTQILSLTPPIYLSGSSTQASIILKHPEDFKINVLTSNANGLASQSVVKDDSIVQYRKFLAFSGGEKQNAVNHQNGRDIWYANHAQSGDSIYFFIIKDDGMIECPAVAHTGLDYYGENGVSTQGQMKFSPDGSYLGECAIVDPFGVGIHKFNNEYANLEQIYTFTKNFSPPYTKRWPYGFEFSSDNSKAYIISGKKSVQENDPVILYQLAMDSLSSDINGNTWIAIDSLWDLDFGALQMGPNGKIYHSQSGRMTIGVMHNPNEDGKDCDYEINGLRLDSGGTSLWGLPAFNQSYFHTPAIDFKYKEDCAENNYQFWGLDTIGSNQQRWTFTNLTTGMTETKSGKNITYQFKAQTLEDKYSVTLIASNGNRTDSVSKILTIRPLLKNDFLGNDTFYCAPHNGDSLVTGIILKTPENLHCIHWNGLEPYSNLVGDTVIGYEHFHSEEFHVDTAGIYTARITNKNFCRAWDTIRVEEKPRPEKPVMSRVSDSIVSSIKSFQYRWFYNGQKIAETERSVFHPEENGYYQIQLVSKFGCESRLSDSFLVDFVGVKEELISKDEIKLYPNPTHGIIYIKQEKPSEVRIEVLDISGKLMASKVFIDEGSSIDISTLPFGVYIVRVIFSDGGQLSCRITFIN